MAVASVEQEAKLGDLWQPQYTVSALKSMTTVSFETPSGTHSYNVVGVNRRDIGGVTTTKIFCSSGHQLQITQSAASLLYPAALVGPQEGVVERRLNHRNGRMT